MIDGPVARGTDEPDRSRLLATYRVLRIGIRIVAVVGFAAFIGAAILGTGGPVAVFGGGLGMTALVALLVMNRLRPLVDSAYAQRRSTGPDRRGHTPGEALRPYARILLGVGLITYLSSALLTLGRTMVLAGFGTFAVGLGLLMALNWRRMSGS